MESDSNKKIPRHDFDEVLANPAWKRAVETMKLPVPIGWDEQGELRVADLAEIGNLILAGRGDNEMFQGAAENGLDDDKLYFLNTMIRALASCRGPEKVKFALVSHLDTDFYAYQKPDFKHLFGAVSRCFAYDDEDEESVIALMSKVVKLNVKRARLDNIDTFCPWREYMSPKELRKVDWKRWRGRLDESHLVVVFDEFADFITGTNREVFRGMLEGLLANCAALRIHFVLSTTRASETVLSRRLLELVPARMAFRMDSEIASRAVLGVSGAERLAYYGDVLFKEGNNSPVRVRCPWLDADSSPEFRKPVNLLPPPEITDEKVLLMSDLIDAIEVIRITDCASVSNFQRKIELSRERAEEVINVLEANGIVSPPCSGVRQILLADEKLKEWKKVLQEGCKDSESVMLDGLVIKKIDFKCADLENCRALNCISGDHIRNKWCSICQYLESENLTLPFTATPAFSFRPNGRSLILRDWEVEGDTVALDVDCNEKRKEVAVSLYSQNGKKKLAHVRALRDRFKLDLPDELDGRVYRRGIPYSAIDEFLERNLRNLPR